MAKRPSAAQMAFGPMVLVAVAQHSPPAQRLVQDALAARFLPLRPRLLVGTCRWRFVRNRTIRASEQQVPGIWGGTLCRKRYADDQVAAAVAAGIGQVVILGAGLDTKAYRLVAPAGVAAFEVDRPANIAYKQNRLHAIYGRVPDRVALVPVDLAVYELERFVSAERA